MENLLNQMLNVNEKKLEMEDIYIQKIKKIKMDYVNLIHNNQLLNAK